MANNEIPPVVLRANRLKIMRKDVIQELKGEGIEATITTFSPDGLVLSGPSSLLRNTASYRNGHIQLQDEASQLIAHLLSPQPGEHVLDLCAGSGAKTTQLAEIMGNRGNILAIDINEKKLISLKELAARLGVAIVETRTGDAVADIITPFIESFDRILVDAPCSGLGTLRRNPEIKWRTQASDITLLAAIQKKILNRAVGYLRPGGSLVYSVCTVMPEENEMVVEDFLRHNRDFKLAPLPESIDRGLIDDKGFFRTSPGRHGTDGFFAALLVKAR